MRKFCYIFVLMLIFLTACNNESDNSPNHYVNVENDQEEVTEDNNNDFGNDEAHEEDIQENETVQEEEVEEVEPLYEMTSISSVKPLEGSGAPENVVLITIDDVFLSENVYALEMAEILDDLDVKAIFFVNGLYIDLEENKQILKKIHELGFEIGNHSMTHQVFSDIPEEEQREQIVQLNDKIEEIIGERPRFFRAPHGINTDVTKQVVEEEGMQWMNWSYGFDFMGPYMEKDALVEIMLDPGKDGENIALTNGSNLLFHDRSFTKDALKEIVEGLKEKGFEILDPALIK